MSSLSTAKMTSQQFLMMGEDPPGVRFELVNGEIVVSPGPTPDHSYIILRLSSILLPYINEHDLGTLLADVDTVFDEETTRRPDLLFVAKRRGKIVREAVMGAPDLCVEVVSPASATMDRMEKCQAVCRVRREALLDRGFGDGGMIEAFALKRRGGLWLAVMGRDKQTVNLPPFAGLSIPLMKVWRQG